MSKATTTWRETWSLSDGRVICIGRLPGFKRPCIYVCDGPEFDILAYCKNDEKAGTFVDLLDLLLFHVIA